MVFNINMPDMSLDTFLRLAASQQLWVHWTDGSPATMMPYEELIHLPEDKIDHIKKVCLNFEDYMLEDCRYEIDTFRELIAIILSQIKEMDPEKFRARLLSSIRVLAIFSNGDLATALKYDDLHHLEEDKPFSGFLYNGVEYSDPNTVCWIARESLPNDLDPQNLKHMGMMIERNGGQLSFTQAFQEAHHKVFPDVNFDRFKDRDWRKRVQVQPQPFSEQPKPSIPKERRLSDEEMRRIRLQRIATFTSNARHPKPSTPEETRPSDKELRSEKSTPEDVAKTMNHPDKILSVNETDLRQANGVQTSVNTHLDLISNKSDGVFRQPSKRGNLLHRHPVLFFIPGSFLIAVLSFGVIAGTMAAYGSLSAISAVISALPFLSFLYPLGPIFAVLAFAALVTSLVVLVYEISLASIYLATSVDMRSTGSISQEIVAYDMGSLPKPVEQNHYNSPIMKPLPRSEGHSCNVAQMP